MDWNSLYFKILYIFSYIATEISTDTLEVLALKGVEDRTNKEPEAAEKSAGSNKEILHNITKAVAYFHNKNMIHGNINPQSIVICEPEPTLTDLKPTPKAKLSNFEIDGYTILYIHISDFSFVLLYDFYTFSQCGYICLCLRTHAQSSRRLESARIRTQSREFIASVWCKHKTFSVCRRDFSTRYCFYSGILIGYRVRLFAFQWPTSVRRRSPSAEQVIFSLSIILFYMVSNFNLILSKRSILFGYLHVSEEKLNDPSAVDLIKRMLESDPATRITIKGVLGHPYFWKGEEAVSFIIRAVDEIIKPEMAIVAEGGESAILAELRKDERPVIRGYWKQYLTPYVRKLIDRRSYDAKTLVGLLLAVRDKVRDNEHST